MAEVEHLLEEMAEEVHEAGFSDFGGLADALQSILDERSEFLSDTQADAVQLAADVLHSLDRYARSPG